MVFLCIKTTLRTLKKLLKVIRFQDIDKLKKKSPFVLNNDEKVGIYNSIKYMKYLGKYLTTYVQDLYIEICTLKFVH